MNRRRLVVPIAAAALFAAGCARDREPLGPPLERDRTIAQLSASDTVVEAGDTILVVARARARLAGAVGSFAATLRYDPASLAFLESLALDGMRAVNATVAGTIVVAGASPAGFADDQLFAVRLVARHAMRVDSLSLEIAELTGVDYDDRRPGLSIQREVALERVRP